MAQDEQSPPPPRDGYVKISRRAYRTHPFWLKERVFSEWEAWEDVIQYAAFRKRRKMIGAFVVELERGEFMASIRFLCERWKWTPKKVRRWLEVVQQWDQIRAQRETQKGTVYLIVNYDIYQRPLRAKGTPKGTKRAQRGHSEGTKNKAVKQGIQDVTDVTSPSFDDFWSGYPKRAGGNPKGRAESAWNARIREGADPNAIIQGRNRYAAYLRAEGKIGTQYVLQAATFLGPDCRFAEDWDPSPRMSPADEKLMRHLQHLESIDLNASRSALYD